MKASFLRTAVIPPLMTIFVLGGCASSNRLGSYQYRDHTLAVITSIPPRPDVFTENFFFIDTDRPLQMVLNAGSAIVKEVEAEKARERLDEAMRYVDVSHRVGDRVLDRSALYLRAQAHPNARNADYVLEVRINEYGIEAESWHANAFFSISAEVILIDGFSGRRIWRTGVEERDPISPRLFAGRTAYNVVTAQALSRLSVDDMIVALEELSDYAADKIIYKLQRDLDRARR